MNAPAPNLPLAEDQVQGALDRGFAVCSRCRRVHGPAGADYWLGWSQPPMCIWAGCHARLDLPRRNGSAEL